VELHHGKHHAAYVAGANTTLERLAAARDRDDLSVLRMLERDLAFHVSGHVLHSLYWTNLHPDGGGAPTGDLATALEETFGGVDAFRRQMDEAVLSVQGSGWALAAWEPTAGRIVVQQVHDHQANHAQGAVPLLAIDAWEHAYYLQYENRKAEYLAGFWNVVSWDEVARRLAAAVHPAEQRSAA
jgi:Fe-Mn family superoxide dismutase